MPEVTDFHQYCSSCVRQIMNLRHLQANWRDYWDRYYHVRGLIGSLEREMRTLKSMDPENPTIKELAMRQSALRDEFGELMERKHSLQNELEMTRFTILGEITTSSHQDPICFQTQSPPPPESDEEEQEKEEEDEEEQRTGHNNSGGGDDNEGNGMKKRHHGYTVRATKKQRT